MIKSMTSLLNVNYCFYFQGYCVLGGSLISEGATWFVAFMSIKKGARENSMSVKDYSMKT